MGRAPLVPSIWQNLKRNLEIILQMGKQVWAFMDEWVRVLLRSLDACRAIEDDLECFGAYWTPKRLAGLEERLAADVGQIGVTP